MKKIFIILLLLSISANIFALDLSIGGGGSVGYTFTRYTLTGGAVESKQTMDRFDYGGSIFFDFTYATFSVGYLGGINRFSENMNVSSSPEDSTEFSYKTGKGSEGALSISLLGKWPIKFKEKVTLFPMFGIDYQIALIQIRETESGLSYNRADGRFMEDRDKDQKPYPLSAWNYARINIGCGADIAFSDKVFLRSEFLFGFRLPTAYEMGALEVVETMMNVKDPKLGGLTGNPTLKLSVGYRLK